MKELKKDVQLTMLSRIPVMLLSFLSVVFLTRLLGPEGNGIYTFSMAVLNLFFTVVGFQIESSLPVFLAREKSDNPRVMSSAALLGVISFVVFVWALALFTFVIPGGEKYVIPEGQPVVFFFIFLIIAFALRRISTFTQATLRGKFKFKAFNIYILLSQLIPVAVYGTLLVLTIKGNEQHDILEYFRIILVVEGALALTGLVILWRTHSVAMSREAFAFVKPISSLSFKNLLSSSGHFLNKRLDVWFVQFFRGTASLGQYGLATQIANFISEAMTPFNQVLVPYVAGSPEDQHKIIVERTARLNMTIALVAAVGIAGTSWLFIPLLFGDIFKEAIPATQVLAIGIIFISQRLVFTSYFRAINTMQHAVKAAWAGVVITVILDIILIPPIGILGAAIATVIAYGISAAYLVMMAKKKLGFALTDILLARKEDIRWLLKKERTSDQVD